jgi:glycerol-3-phosphate acyltransferase PlsY
MEKIYCLVIGYCFGMILTAEIVARLLTGKSSSALGTGNPGMANIMSQLGVKPGAAVLAGDIIKTAAPVLLCYFIFPQVGRIAMLYAGLGACLGHDFPIWRGFRGGKNVTSSIVTMIGFSPVFGTLSAFAGMFVVLTTGYLPIGAVVITALFTAFAFPLYGTEAGALALALCLLTISRHWRGVLRALRGTEPRKMKLLGKKKK